MLPVTGVRYGTAFCRPSNPAARISGAWRRLADAQTLHTCVGVCVTRPEGKVASVGSRILTRSIFFFQKVNSFVNQKKIYNRFIRNVTVYTRIHISDQKFELNNIYL